MIQVYGTTLSAGFKMEFLTTNKNHKILCNKQNYTGTDDDTDRLLNYLILLT